MTTFGRRRSVGLGLLTTGVVCPCHVLVGVVGLMTGGALLSPAAQDGLHAVYVPLAILAGAALLGKPRSRPAKRRTLTSRQGLQAKELAAGVGTLRRRSH